MRAVLDTSYLVHWASESSQTHADEPYLAGHELIVPVVALAEIPGAVQSVKGWTDEMSGRVESRIASRLYPVANDDLILHAAYSVLCERWNAIRGILDGWDYHAIGQNDLWIAAVAVRLKATLVTGDSRHALFGAIGGYKAIHVHSRGGVLLVGH